MNFLECSRIVNEAKINDELYTRYKVYQLNYLKESSTGRKSGFIKHEDFISPTIYATKLVGNTKSISLYLKREAKWHTENQRLKFAKFFDNVSIILMNDYNRYGDKRKYCQLIILAIRIK